MEKVRQLVSAIIAGMLIGVGGTVFLSLQNAVVGSFLFAIGLFSIVGFQLQLFTGKIGYLIFEEPEYLIELAITWLGNLIGTYTAACMVQNTRIFQGISEKVTGIVAVKLEDKLSSIFLLAIFCGMLMFIAVDLYRNLQGAMQKSIAVFIPVVVFILSGFEHVIANMFYFSLANVWNGHTLVSIFVTTLGNSLGGLFIPTYLKLFRLR